MQSTALLVLIEQGKVAADLAVFADTGSEPRWVYETLDRMRAWSSTPIEVVSRGNLRDDILDAIRRGGSISTPPFFVRGAGRDGVPLRRQCTRDYKIRPIEGYIRRHLGYTPHASIPVGTVRCLKGISADEVYRMKTSTTPWIEAAYPLVDLRVNRLDCEQIIRRAGLPIPRRSACTFCPYHGDTEWQQLRDHDPEGWRNVLALDEALRTHGIKGLREKPHVHKSLRPLGEIDLDRQLRFDMPDQFANECEGTCGV